MDNHSCEAIVITCIDYRFQQFIDDWIKKHFKARTYDRGAFAGAAKSLETILNQIDTAYRLHHIKKAIIINHEDCGAYEEVGTEEKHSQDLKAARDKIRERFPDLEVETYYLKLDGTFEQIF